MEWVEGRTSTVFYLKFLSDNSKAFLRYRVENSKLLLVETYTPPQHRGKGAAKRLVEMALEYARENSLEVVPICSYSIHYFIKNREARDILAEPYKSMSTEELTKYFEEARRREAEKQRKEARH